jgi:hypothetical protein
MGKNMFEEFKLSNDFGKAVTASNILNKKRLIALNCIEDFKVVSEEEEGHYLDFSKNIKDVVNPKTIGLDSIDPRKEIQYMNKMVKEGTPWKRIWEQEVILKMYAETTLNKESVTIEGIKSDILALGIEEDNATRLATLFYNVKNKKETQSAPE